MSVLVIDPDPAEQDRCRALLAGIGLEAISALEWHTTLDLVSRPEANVEAVLLRWDLKSSDGLTGPQLLVRLVQTRPELPVVVVSDTLDLGRARHSHELGARGCLMKPLERESFRDVIWDALRQTPLPQLMPKLHEKIIGQSKGLLATLAGLARFIPQADVNILLVGENGTGKELFAQAVHELGPTHMAPWVPVNLAETPPDLLESHLFGSERGAFTGAVSSHCGFFEQVQAGTLFLDEIGELQAHLQAKLLRVLQERRFRRVGGDIELEFSGRLVCATNKNLAVECVQGRFRHDLYHRLAGCEVRIPPLRERGDDLWLLVSHFLARFAPDSGVTLARETKALLTQYPFPGNVRELSNVLHEAVLRRDGFTVFPRHLPLDVLHERAGKPDLEEPRGAWTPTWPQDLLDLPQKQAMERLEQAFNRTYLPLQLKAAAGRIIQAAKLAGLDPKTFRKKWNEAGLPSLREGD